MGSLGSRLQPTQDCRGHWHLPGCSEPQPDHLTPAPGSLEQAAPPGEHLSAALQVQTQATLRLASGEGGQLGSRGTLPFLLPSLPPSWGPNIHTFTRRPVGSRLILSPSGMTFLVGESPPTHGVCVCVTAPSVASAPPAHSSFLICTVDFGGLGTGIARPLASSGEWGSVCSGAQSLLK